jgi:hypothetical protein
MPVAAAMGIVTVSAYTSLESSMHIGFFEEISDIFMAAQACSVYVISYQPLIVTYMHVMAGAAFALFKGEMHVLLQQLFLQLGMALETSIGEIALDRSLSSGNSQRKAQQKNAKGIQYSFIHVSFIHVSFIHVSFIHVSFIHVSFIHVS